MTDFSAQIQLPNISGVTPTYNTCTATDKFAAVRGARYMLHYKNGATPTGALTITDQTSVAPPGAVPGGGWADAKHTPSSLGASAEKVVWLDAVDRFRDATGFVNLAHATPTTLTVAIFGPF